MAQEGSLKGIPLVMLVLAVRLNEVFRYLLEHLFMLDGGKFRANFTWVHGRS